MATTYTLIQATALASDTATVTFSSIPNTYTDLLLLFSSRSSANNESPFNNQKLRFNGDTGSNYSARGLFGNGSSATSGSNSGDSILFNYGNASDTTANTFSNGQIYIPNYTSSNQKSVSIDCAVENNATSAFANFTAALWTGTAAITSISLTDNYGNLKTNSTFYLYGISNA